MNREEILAQLEVAALDYVESTPEWANKFEAMRRAVKHVEKVEKAFLRVERMALASLGTLEQKEM